VNAVLVPVKLVLPDVVATVPAVISVTVWINPFVMSQDHGYLEAISFDVIFAHLVNLV